jgi:hypothetical protein
MNAIASKPFGERRDRTVNSVIAPPKPCEKSSLTRDFTFELGREPASQTLLALPAPEPDAPGEIRIILADDHTLFRECLRDVLQAEADFRVIAEAGSGEAAVTRPQDILRTSSFSTSRCRRTISPRWYRACWPYARHRESLC